MEDLLAVAWRICWLLYAREHFSDQLIDSEKFKGYNNNVAPFVLEVKYEP